MPYHKDGAEPQAGFEQREMSFCPLLKLLERREGIATGQGRVSDLGLDAYLYTRFPMLPNDQPPSTPTLASFPARGRFAPYPWQVRRVKDRACHCTPLVAR